MVNKGTSREEKAQIESNVHVTDTPTVYVPPHVKARSTVVTAATNIALPSKSMQLTRRLEVC